jgi:hypothetical protein
MTSNRDHQRSAVRHIRASWKIGILLTKDPERSGDPFRSWFDFFKNSRWIYFIHKKLRLLEQSHFFY